MNEIGNNCVLRTLVRIELVASLQLKLNNNSDKAPFCQISKNLKCLWKESRPFRRQKISIYCLMDYEAQKIKSKNHFKIMIRVLRTVGLIQK